MGEGTVEDQTMVFTLGIHLAKFGENFQLPLSGFLPGKWNLLVKVTRNRAKSVVLLAKKLLFGTNIRKRLIQQIHRK